MTLTVHRITSKKYQSSIWSGEGGVLADSRWLPAGYRVVYTAQSLALAVLEYMVHDPLFRHGDVVTANAQIPDDIAITDAEQLHIEPDPRTPHIDEVRGVGVLWAEAEETAVIKVPSAIIQGEYNYILNVGHPDFGRLTLGNATSFVPDPRLTRAT